MEHSPLFMGPMLGSIRGMFQLTPRHCCSSPTVFVTRSDSEHHVHQPFGGASTAGNMQDSTTSDRKRPSCIPAHTGVLWCKGVATQHSTERYRLADCHATAKATVPWSAVCTTSTSNKHHSPPGSALLPNISTSCHSTAVRLACSNPQPKPDRAGQCTATKVHPHSLVPPQIDLISRTTRVPPLTLPACNQ